MQYCTLMVMYTQTLDHQFNDDELLYRSGAHKRNSQTFPHENSIRIEFLNNRILACIT